MTTYVVTGASTGIGRACASRLVARGATVFAGVRREADGRTLRRDLGPRLRPLPLDVTDAAQIIAARDTVSARLGDEPLDGVVNNAGIAVGGPVEYLPVDAWRDQFEVNLFGVVETTKAFLDLLRRGPGRNVIVGSVGGRVASPLLAPYSASKHAIEALAESLRHELREWGIATVVVEPGAVATPIWDKGRDQANRLEHELSPEAIDRYGRFIEIVRRAIDQQEKTGVDPDRVAQVVERALVAPRPRARYLVGVDAYAQAVMARLLPDRLRDAAQRAFLDRM
jgi:NAD(P)-dependent dehydrogenase (short-subunit alcohol dehydrogenase family)